MKRIVAAAFLVAGCGALAASAEELTGYVSDAHCGAKHTAVSEKNTKCVDMCLKGGADPVLVSNGKVIKFDAASKEKAQALAGQTVKVSGTVEGDTIKVDTIEKSST